MVFSLGFVVSLLLAMICVVSYKNTNKMNGPIFLYSLQWSIIAFFASCRLFTMFSVSYYCWIIILFGSVSFFVGAILGERIKFKNRELDNTDKFYNNFLSVKWVVILIFLVVISVVIDIRQTYGLLGLGYNLGDIRTAYNGQMEISEYTRTYGVLQSLKNLFVAIIKLITVATCIVYSLHNIRKNYCLIIIAISLELLDSLTYGGRFGLAYFIIELLVCFSIMNKIGLSIRKKIKRKIIYICLFLLSFIVFITLIRGVELGELTQKYYRYLCGNIVYFDINLIRLENLNFKSLSFASLYGFWNVFLPFLTKFGVELPDLYKETIWFVLDTQEFKQIGEILYTNAFITPFYHPYADFGIIGVFIAMAVFGILSGYAYKRACFYKDASSIVLYLIVVQMIFKSLQTYPFVLSNYFYAIVLMFLVSRLRFRY